MYVENNIGLDLLGFPNLIFKKSIIFNFQYLNRDKFLCFILFLSYIMCLIFYIQIQNTLFKISFFLRKSLWDVSEADPRPGGCLTQECRAFVTNLSQIVDRIAACVLILILILGKLL